MQLCEQETNWEFKNNLPGLVLPCPVSHSKAKSKNTDVPKTQSGASAGLKQFIAEQRAKNEEDPQ